jgi:hypothetical protein
MNQLLTLAIVVAVLLGLSSAFQHIISNTNRHRFTQMSMQRPSNAFAAIAVGLGLTMPMIAMPESIYAATQATTVKSSSTKPAPAKSAPAKKGGDSLKGNAIDKELEKLGIAQGTDAEETKKLGEELAVEGAISNRIISRARLDELTSEITSFRTKAATAKSEIARLINKAETLERKMKAKDVDKDVKRLSLEEAKLYRKDAADVRLFRCSR